MKDKIVTEVWRVRDMLSAKYGHVPDKIATAIRERERHPLTPLRGKNKPTQSPQDKTTTE